MLVCPKCGRVGFCTIKVTDHFEGVDSNGEYTTDKIRDANVTEGYLRRVQYYGKPRCIKCNNELRVVKNLNELYNNYIKNDFVDTVNGIVKSREAKLILKKFNELFENCIVIPKGTTYGDLIKSITNKKFDNGDSDYNDDLMISEGKDYISCSINFWNKQYDVEE